MEMYAHFKHQVITDGLLQGCNTVLSLKNEMHVVSLKLQEMQPCYIVL